MPAQFQENWSEINALLTANNPHHNQQLVNALNRLLGKVTILEERVKELEGYLTPLPVNVQVHDIEISDEPSNSELLEQICHRISIDTKEKYDFNHSNLSLRHIVQYLLIQVHKLQHDAKPDNLLANVERALRKLREIEYRSSRGMH